MSLSRYLSRLIWLCVVPLLCVSVWLAYTHVEGIRTQNIRRADDIARNMAGAIDHHLSARLGALSALASSPLAAKQATWPAFYQEAQAFQHNFGSHVILARGTQPLQMIFNTRVSFGSPLPALPKIKGKSAALQVIQTQKVSVSDLFYGPIAQEPLISMAAPIKQAGKLHSLLIATFTAQHFQERIDEIALPTGWGLALLDSQGEVIAKRNMESLDLTTPSESGYQTKAYSSQSPWSIVVSIPDSAFSKPILSASLAVASAILIAALVGLGGGLWGTRRIGQAVTHLADPTQTPDANGPEIREITEVRQRLREDSLRIANFAAAQDQAIEQERRRVAREVHDQMGQVFTALKLIVQSIPKQAFPTNQESALHTALEMGITSARRITAELRPPLLDDFGFAPALEHFMLERTHNTTITPHLEIRDTHYLTPLQSLGLFRITQEAVTNIFRHADASEIHLRGSYQEGKYVLSIEDNGKGFNPSTIRKGAMGMTIMQERCRMLSGIFHVSSVPNGGTRITLSLPVGTQGSPDANSVN